MRQKWHQDLPELLLQRHTALESVSSFVPAWEKLRHILYHLPVEVQSELSRWWRNCRQIKVCEVLEATRWERWKPPRRWHRAGIRPGACSGGSGIFMPPSECQSWGLGFTLCLSPAHLWSLWFGVTVRQFQSCSDTGLGAFNLECFGWLCPPMWVSELGLRFHSLLNCRGEPERLLLQSVSYLKCKNAANIAYVMDIHRGGYFKLNLLKYK